jgi:hypothetical protein
MEDMQRRIARADLRQEKVDAIQVSGECRRRGSEKVEALSS